MAPEERAKQLWLWLESRGVIRKDWHAMMEEDRGLITNTLCNAIREAVAEERKKWQRLYDELRSEHHGAIESLRKALAELDTIRSRESQKAVEPA